MGTEIVTGIDVLSENGNAIFPFILEVDSNDFIPLMVVEAPNQQVNMNLGRCAAGLAACHKDREKNFQDCRNRGLGVCIIGCKFRFRGKIGKGKNKRARTCKEEFFGPHHPKKGPITSNQAKCIAACEIIYVGGGCSVEDRRGRSCCGEKYNECMATGVWPGNSVFWWAKGCPIRFWDCEQCNL